MYHCVEVTARQVGGAWSHLQVPSGVVLPTGSAGFGRINGATLRRLGSLLGSVSSGHVLCVMGQKHNEC